MNLNVASSVARLASSTLVVARRMRSIIDFIMSLRLLLLLLNTLHLNRLVTVTGWWLH